MIADRLEPFFLDTEGGQIFALFRGPPEAKRCALIVPPFAEEMNKCRRQFTELSQNLANRGVATLLIDLFGTGDSEGEFADASWPVWKENVSSALAWAVARGVPVDTLIAVRLGCLLAAEVVIDLDSTVRKTVFWQAVTSGRQYMTQFLRLRVASSMMEQDKPETVDGLRARLRNGESLEVAGYELSSELWAGIENSDLLANLGMQLGNLKVCEIGRLRDGTLSPAGQKLIEAAEQSGLPVSGSRISGEPFWSATEIVTNSVLNDSTMRFVANQGR